VRLSFRVCEDMSVQGSGVRGASTDNPRQLQTGFRPVVIVTRRTRGKSTCPSIRPLGNP